MRRSSVYGLAIFGGLVLAIGANAQEQKAKAAGNEKKVGGMTRHAATQPAYLDKEHAPKGKGWVSLFDGKDLAGWKPRHGTETKSWKVADGMMSNTPSEKQHGVDLVSEPKFKDFEIYLEYRIPKGSNSGLYLRGRYELQILDDFGQQPGQGSNGAIYGVRAPDKNASKKPGEWQSVYARMVGQKITAFLNGVKIHDNAEVLHPTGAALDDKQDQPGPIMIQGDHGAIEVRCVMVRPLEARKAEKSR